MNNPLRTISIVALIVAVIGLLLNLGHAVSGFLSQSGGVILTILFAVLLVFFSGPIYLVYFFTSGMRTEPIVTILAILFIITALYSIYMIIIKDHRRLWWWIFSLLTPFIPAILMSYGEVQPFKSKVTPPVDSVPAQPIGISNKPVVDLRSNEEIKMQHDTQLGVSDEDESLARRLVQLEQRSNTEFESDKVAFNHTQTEVHRIGELLNERGGEDHMKRVLYRVQALGGHTRWIEGVWNGIGTWMG